MKDESPVSDLATFGLEVDEGDKSVAFSTLHAEMQVILSRIHRLRREGGTERQIQREVAKLVAMVTNFQRLFSPIAGMPDVAMKRVQELQDRASLMFSNLNAGVYPVLHGLLSGAWGVAEDIIHYHMPEDDVSKHKGLIGSTINSVREVFSAFRSLVALGEAHHDNSFTSEAYTNPATTVNSPVRQPVEGRIDDEEKSNLPDTVIQDGQTTVWPINPKPP